MVGSAGSGPVAVDLDLDLGYDTVMGADESGFLDVLKMTSSAVGHIQLANRPVRMASRV
jgi:hypothetical protein